MGIAILLLVYAGWQIKSRLDAANGFATGQMAALVETLEESQRGPKVVKDTKAAPAPHVAAPASKQAAAQPPQMADMPAPGTLAI